MKTIRASEIGTFLYCQRAWGYLKSGHEPLNQAELAAGTRLHEQHGRRVLVAGSLRVLAYVLLAASLLLVVIYMIDNVL
jgi:hypothetical protein